MGQLLAADCVREVRHPGDRTQAPLLRVAHATDGRGDWLLGNGAEGVMAEGSPDRRRHDQRRLMWLRHPIMWVRSWSILNLPPRVLVYVLVVEAFALLAAAYTWSSFPVSTTDWFHAGVLAGCAVVHIELTCKIERKREVSAGAGPYLDYKSVWNFAGLLILPPVLATAMVVLTYTYAWMRIWNRRKTVLAGFRWVFSCATVVLATQVAVAVLVFALPTYPGMPNTVSGLAAICAAAAVRWLVNYSLVLLVLALHQPQLTARDLTSNLRDQMMEAGAAAFGMCTAGLLVSEPIWVVAPVIGLIAMHPTVLLGQYERAAQTDAKTGLHTGEYWAQYAQNVLKRAQVNDTKTGVMLLDIDFFKKVNDTYGHLAGDDVLRAVADAIKGEIRTGIDEVGRFGGEEFLVVLPELEDEEELRVTAERIRIRISTVLVPAPKPKVIKGDRTFEGIRVTASIGAALAPDNGTELEDLKNQADMALYRAKNTGRDKVVLAGDIGTEEPDLLINVPNLMD